MVLCLWQEALHIAQCTCQWVCAYHLLSLLLETENCIRNANIPNQQTEHGLGHLAILAVYTCMKASKCLLRIDICNL